MSMLKVYFRSDGLSKVLLLEEYSLPLFEAIQQILKHNYQNQGPTYHGESIQNYPRQPS